VFDELIGLVFFLIFESQPLPALGGRKAVVRERGCRGGGMSVWGTGNGGVEVWETRAGAAR